jgi:CYTH domain-containing protein
MEIERRWLLRNIPNPVTGLVTKSLFTKIEQRYFPPFRLRKNIIPTTGDKQYYITIKVGHGLSRPEWEESIPIWAFNEVWPLGEKLHISKRRYWISIPNYHVTVDIFTGNLLGLIILEAEASSEELAEKFIMPKDLEEHVIKEITGIPRYSNFELAKSQTIPMEI